MTCLKCLSVPKMTVVLKWLGFMAGKGLQLLRFPVIVGVVFCCFLHRAADDGLGITNDDLLWFLFNIIPVLTVGGRLVVLLETSKPSALRPLEVYCLLFCSAKM